MKVRPLSVISRIDSIENHCFFPHALSAGALVIDLGANQGHFSRTISRRYGLRCIGVEANPALHAKLQAQQQNNGDERVRFLNFAICGADEPVMLQVSGYITSSTITRGDIPDPQGTVVVPGKTLATFFSEQGIDRVDLMKIDIEGAEVGVFESTSDEVLRRIRQMSIEFHDEHGFMTRQQFEQIRTRLLDLGFCGIKFSSNNTNWLFFRPEVAGPITRAYVRYLVRNARGALRRAGLRFG